MGTASIVAEPYGDSYRGRYVHWDGYPTGVGADLVTLVRRDGLTAVRQTLLHDHGYWSSISPAPNSELGGDSSFQSVDGYGVASASRAAEVGDWIYGGGDQWGAEYVHVITDAGLLCMALRDDGTPHDAGVLVPWGDRAHVLKLGAYESHPHTLP